MSDWIIEPQRAAYDLRVLLLTAAIIVAIAVVAWFRK